MCIALIEQMSLQSRTVHVQVLVLGSSKASTPGTRGLGTCAGEMEGFSARVCFGEVACKGEVVCCACSVCVTCWCQSCSHISSWIRMVFQGQVRQWLVQNEKRRAVAN